MRRVSLWVALAGIVVVLSAACSGGSDDSTPASSQPPASTVADQTPSPTPGTDGTVSTALAAGGAHSCALTVDDGVKCWGSNELGRLGDGRASGDFSDEPVNVVGLSEGVVALAAGGAHSCALTVDDGVKCWGSNESGRLGDGGGSGDFSNEPVNVVGVWD
jgi:alpha-tubulin suppressor-like RCC1 family protein